MIALNPAGKGDFTIAIRTWQHGFQHGLAFGKPQGVVEPVLKCILPRYNFYSAIQKYNLL